MNPSEWEFIEQSASVIIGVSEILTGLLLIVLGYLSIPFFGLNLAPWLSGTLSDLGVGLLASGIITSTLEPISRKRLQSDIKEIKEAHFESVLKGLMPEPIFREVQAHIIRQPFLRMNCDATLELEWVDEKREYLHKSLVGSCEVKNVSQTLERYELRVSEERINEDKFPESTRIREIRVQPSGDKFMEAIVYKGPDLEKLVKKTQQYVRVVIPIILKPDQKVRIVTHVESILSNRDVYSLVMNKPTIHLDLTISHPEDLIVRALPMHPSEKSFITEVDTSRVKRWRISTALLPFQGIEVSWQPKEERKKED